MGFINRNEDTQDSCCPRVEDKSLSEHVGVKIELSHWVESEHSNSRLDTNIHSSTNNGDNSLFKILTVIFIFKNPGVNNVNIDSDPKAWRKIKLPIDRKGFVNGNTGTGSLCDSRVWREHSLECFSINVYSPGSDENQKQSVNVIKFKLQ